MTEAPEIRFCTYALGKSRAPRELRQLMHNEMARHGLSLAAGDDTPCARQRVQRRGILTSAGNSTTSPNIAAFKTVSNTAATNAVGTGSVVADVLIGAGLARVPRRIWAIDMH